MEIETQIIVLIGYAAIVAVYWCALIGVLIMTFQQKITAIHDRLEEMVATDNRHESVVGELREDTDSVNANLQWFVDVLAHALGIKEE